LSHALIRVLTNSGEATHMGENGYRHARERFNAQANIEATVTIYERLLAAE